MLVRVLFVSCLSSQLRLLKGQNCICLDTYEITLAPQSGDLPGERIGHCLVIVNESRLLLWGGVGLPFSNLQDTEEEDRLNDIFLDIVV